MDTEPSKRNALCVDRDVPRFLASRVRMFARSEELAQLDETEKGLSGLVCASFTRFFVRLQELSLDGHLDRDGQEALSQSYGAIEDLASSNDPDTRNLVVVEIYENIDCDKAVLAIIVGRLWARSRRLYDEWFTNVDH